LLANTAAAALLPGTTTGQGAVLARGRRPACRASEPGARDTRAALSRDVVPPAGSASDQHFWGHAASLEDASSYWSSRRRRPACRAAACSLHERRAPKLARQAASPKTPSSARLRSLRAAASAAPLPPATEPARRHARLPVSCAPTPRGCRTPDHPAADSHTLACMWQMRCERWQQMRW
jgi:hypothetical protein